MLDTQQRTLVKATAPILHEHGEALMRHFYARMFEHNPELKPMFNQGHQQSGSQQKALSSAVAAYAQNIDDPSVLAPVLTIIAHKHASLGIRAEHYPIVGHHLLSSIREVLGAAATDELIAAWAAAYGQLADVLIGIEAQLYHDNVQKQGGWSGWRTFEITRKEVESDEITSFYFSPIDGGHIPDYQSGQYITVNVYVPQLGMMQARQYSLSQAANSGHLRVSIKREAEHTSKPAGMVSNQLHDALEVGMRLDLAAPAGEFTLRDNDAPIVLISAGVGATPLLAMAQTALTKPSEQPVLFIHACRHGGVHAFKDWVSAQKPDQPRFRSLTYYEHPRHNDILGQDFDSAGRLNLLDISERLPDNAEYYLCGPMPFMHAHKNALVSLGIDPTRIFTEAFGSGQV